MHPRRFEYVRAESVEEAVGLLAGEPDARLIAGGQSLVPMMSMGLTRPTRLVDIGRLPAAAVIENEDTVVVDGLTCHRQLELEAVYREILPLAAEVAPSIGNPRVRNRGTLAGSLAHSDPAAELGAVVLTYGGKALIEGTTGHRSVALDDFFVSYFTTALEAGEILVGVELDRPPAGTGHGFFEIAGRADDFATAAATALVTLDPESGTCARARLAVAGVDERPLRLDAPANLCRDQALSDELLDEVAAEVRSAVNPEGDAFISADYRRKAAGVCAARALAAAWDRAAQPQRSTEVVR